MKKLFVILATQRSGSTYLRSWLNRHPDIRCHEEIFLPKQEYAESFASFLRDKMRGRKMVEELISQGHTSLFPVNLYFSLYMRQLRSSRPKVLSFDELWQASSFRPCANKCDATWVGYKLMYNQINIVPSLLNYHLKHVSKCIHLVRRNVLEILVSRLIAEKTGIWHSKNETKQTSIFIEPDYALKEYRSIANLQNKHSELASRWGGVTVYYEDFFNEFKQKNEMKKILSYLDLDVNVEIKPVNLTKIIKMPIASVIENYLEVREHLLLGGVDLEKIGE
jgi:LPS sulfotransferase NodH